MGRSGNTPKWESAEAGIGLSGLTETWQICAPIRALRLRADMGHVCYQELAHSANAFFRKVAPLSWPTDRGCATLTSRGRRRMGCRPDRC